MGDLQVASTTDTQEEVNQAAGAREAVEEIKEKGDDQVDSEAVEQQEEKPAPKAEEKDPSAKLVKRIDKLTAQKSAAERRVAEVEAELAKAKTARPAVEEKAPVVEEKAAADPEPKQDDFDTYEKWVKAQARWEVRQEIKEQQAAEVKAQEEEAAKEVVSTYNERVSEFKAEHDDWDEVVGAATVTIHPGVKVALLYMEEGPEIVYYLASNQDYAKKLWGMNEALAIVEVGKLAKAIAQEEKSAPAADRKSGPDKLPVSNAPPPIRQLSGHSTRQPASLSDPDIDYNAWRKIRDKQEKERYRR